MIAATLIGTLAVVLNIVQSDGFMRKDFLFLAQTRLSSAIHQDLSGEEILTDATVEIKMAYQRPHSKRVEDKLLATGLGSLVRDGSKTLLVTHNHWGEVLADTTVITIYDVQQKVLLILLGVDFQDLVINRDAGTLVLEAPLELAGLVSADSRMGNSEKVMPDDNLQVVYHQTGNRSRITLQEAKVEAIKDYKGLPVFVLRSLNGNPIVGGDSGGGIWLDGRLVGNMWATITKPDTSQPTNMSYAALLP